MTASPTAPVVLIGVGEMGGVFGRAFLRYGSAVYPALRTTSLEELAAAVPEPALALVTVGEADLDAALATIPESWKGRLGLLQNELLPRDWERHGISQPTVAVVWFEKKPGSDVKVIIPSPIAGAQATMVSAALEAIGIPAAATPADRLLFELVRKNLYILTVNIAGLVAGGTVGALWRDHRDLVRAVVKDVLAIQYWLCASTLDSDELVAGMVATINADPDHQATGRSAPARLERALSHATSGGLAVPTLEQIQRDTA